MHFNIPLDQGKADRLIDLLELSSRSRILDAGCGTGEFLVRALERSGAEGLGLDREAEALAVARHQAKIRLDAGRWEFREEDLRTARLPPGTFDRVICLGATHAFGDGEAAYPEALAALGAALRPGGLLLIGEGYWKQPPAPGYLEVIGDPVGIYHDHAGNLAVAEAAGWVPLYAVVSSEDEWDHFEWSHRMAVEKRAIADPGPGTDEALVRSRRWRDAYLRWGRATMGFGLYLLMRP